MTVAQSINQIAGHGLRPMVKKSVAHEIKKLIANKQTADAMALYWEKVTVNEKTGLVVLEHPRLNGVTVNSMLRKDEWEELDRAVVEEAHDRLNAISRLQEAGLVYRLGSIGVLVSQWNTISEMDRATVSVEGNTMASMDLVDHKLHGVTIPVVHKRFDLSARVLEASRAYGSPIDTSNAREATRVVNEEWERMFFVGNTTVNLNGNPIYGVTTEPNINTGSAAGDFGTISNIYPTFLAMVNAAAADNYHGPIEFWVYKTQFNEMQNRYTDGSGQTALQAVLQIEQVRAVHPTDRMSDGKLVGVQMQQDVVDVAITEGPSLKEWVSPDGFTSHFAVTAVGAPRVKSTYSGRSGIVYYTGA